MARILPAQGPISVFVHHNPLHAFEDLPFEDAVVGAGRLLGCEPFLSEARYREALSRGRITDRDLDAELDGALGGRGAELVAPGIARHDLHRRLLTDGLVDLRGPGLDWALGQGMVAVGSDGGLWDACLHAVERAPPIDAKEELVAVRHRDLLLAHFGVDIDDWVHPILIRLAGAFLDQGLAEWSMPARESGLLSCFRGLYRGALGLVCRPFGSELRAILRTETLDPRESLTGSLDALGVGQAEWESFLGAEALALRGFAGMIAQFEERPDRVPNAAVNARLIDFLAVRMILVRAAVLHAARDLGFMGELAAVRSWLRTRRAEASVVSDEERAFAVFQVARLCRLSPDAVEALTSGEVAAIERELETFDSTTRRALLHRCYERHLRHHILDTLAGHEPEPTRSVTLQAIFCIDEREESIRRHLEEVEPEMETYGAAGFFGVAMYYRGATDAHARPLCPVSVQPRHHVTEVEAPESGRMTTYRRALSHLGTAVEQSIHVGGRRAGRGALLMATLGVLWVLPLVLRVVFPLLRRHVADLYRSLERAPRTRLLVEHDPEGHSPALGEQQGFTTPEMADIVERLLLPLGIGGRFASLVFVVGHGSSSLNNPHESAHDCGACGGGRGGPNARAFAQMANNPAVRALLHGRGMAIPDRTWFVGAQRNTASNDVEVFDDDQIPGDHRPLLARGLAAFDEARRREAHERCRRFEAVPPWLPSLGALLHVQSRAVDIAQPRPEYGHASNALCVVGRRVRTRGLFLDRRAFLVSYDPSLDPDGSRLDGLLSAVVPVVVGINLEYLFGYVDPIGYGCGTKLPHNVTGLVGVMDGAQSDLRPGLPWQMLEIHEPVRLTIVVEAKPEVVAHLAAHNDALRDLVRRQWLFLASLDPDDGVVHEIGGDGAVRYVPEHPVRQVDGPSRAYYGGSRDHLPFVELDPSGSDPR